MSRLFEARAWNSTLPARTKHMKRSELRKANRKRKAERYREHFGSKAEYVRQLPCCVCGRAAPSEPHHYPSRGAGGTSKDLVPLCTAHHREFHMGAETFQARYGVDLKARAARYEAWFHESPQPLGF